jgi:hypothetical protein
MYMNNNRSALLGVFTTNTNRYYSGNTKKQHHLMFIQHVDYLVHFERFRNIDLAGKGLYFVRVVLNPSDPSNQATIECKVRHTSTGMCRSFCLSVCVSVLTNTIANRNAKNSSEAVDKLMQQVRQNRPEFNATVETDENTNVCRSQVFMIRYREQEVLLDELFHFTLKIEVARMQMNNVIDLEFDLFYYKLQYVFSLYDGSLTQSY